MWINGAGEEIKRKPTARWQYNVATGEYRKQRNFKALSGKVMRLAKAACQPDEAAARLVWQLWLDGRDGGVGPE